MQDSYNRDHLQRSVTAVNLPDRSSTPIASPSHADAVSAEGLRLQYESMSTTYIASGTLATVVAAIYQQNMPLSVWLPWVLAVYLQTFARWKLRQRFMAMAPGTFDPKRWGRYATIGALTSGILWGWATIIGWTHGGPIMEFLMVPMILLFGVAAAMSAISYLPVYYAFFIPSTLPGIIVLMLHSERLQFLTGIAYACFLLMLTRFAHALHASFKTTTRLRIENSDLVKALRDEKTAAEAANLAKSRFLAAASHDLRQPMHALSLFIASFPTANLPTQERDLLANMRRSADAMESLFVALLDVSRLDAGVVEPRPEPMDVEAFGTRLYQEFAPLARERDLQLRLRSTRATIVCDPILLHRIVANLLTNAIRYGQREGALLAFRVRNGNLAIEVWDTGVGIAPADQEAIFREFYQVGNVERDREKGLGLGLAIVDRLVKLLGLRLELRSSLGRGSVFRVWVPLQSRSAAAAKPIQPVQGSDPIANEPLGLRIAVIDDERDVRIATQLLLTGWGCTVVSAGSAEEFIANEPRSPIPDLIIADLRLRANATGIEAIAMLRQHFGRAVPGIILSGDTLPARLKEVRDSGLAMLHKPIRPERLRVILKAAVRPS
jgi:two-component system, sensor histidine kinase